MTRRPIAKSRNQAPGAALRNAWLVLLLLAVVQPSATCLEPKRLPPLLLIPTPQLVARKPGSFRFTDGMRIAVAESGCGHDRFAARQLAEAARSDLGINIEIGPASGAPCIIIGQLGRDKSVEAALGKHLLDLAGGLGEQGYALAIRSSSIVIAGGGAAGAFYGVQTLKQIIRANATGKAIPCCEIVDWPQLRYRGWQDDISRGPIPTLDFLKRQIRNMSELKLNFFTMYTEHVFKLTKHPKIAPPDGITEDEVQELVRYAKQYHVEIAGNFQSFGHFANILRVPEYSHLGEASWLICPAKEESYRFLSDVYSEIAPAYDSALFNINCDETVGLGKGASKKMVEEMGVAGVYAYHINKLAELLAAYGKTPMMWGDIALHYRDIIPKLPPDLIVLSWGYHAGSSFDGAVVPFTEAGLRFIVCPGISNWNRVFPDCRTAFVNISNYIRDGARHGALGVVNTTWDDDGEVLFGWNWYPLAWGAECSWRPEIVRQGDDLDMARDVRKLTFDRAFAQVFYGAPDSTITGALNRLSALRRYAVSEELANRAFWRDPLELPHMRLEAVQRKIGDYVEEADSLIEDMRRAIPSARRNSDSIDCAVLAARRARFLGRRALVRVSNGRDLAAAGTNAEQAQEALNSIRARVGALRAEVDSMQCEYARLWRMENRPWWLDRNLAKYRALSEKLRSYEDKIAAAAEDMKQRGKWPDAQKLCLDLPEAGSRSCSPTLLAQADAALLNSEWEVERAKWRIPLTWNAGEAERVDSPTELFLDLRQLLPEGAAPNLKAPVLVESLPSGGCRTMPVQLDPLPEGKTRLAFVLPGASPAGKDRTLWLYLSPRMSDEEGQAHTIREEKTFPGAVSARNDGTKGCWVENDRFRAYVGREGGHVYSWCVKALGGTDVAMPGNTDWHGFSDMGRPSRRTYYRLELIAAGPVLVRIQCIPFGYGMEKELSFWAGAGWFESILETPVDFYWDYDAPSIMSVESQTPGGFLFSDGSSGVLPALGQLSVQRANSLWGLKRRTDGLVLANITPGVRCTHRVGPGGGMGGAGIEAGGRAWHFVTLCDVVEGDPAQACNRLEATLSLKSGPRVTVAPAQERR